MSSQRSKPKNKQPRKKEEQKVYSSNQSNDALLNQKNIESSNGLEEVFSTGIGSLSKPTNMQGNGVRNFVANNDLTNSQPQEFIAVNKSIPSKPPEYKDYIVFPIQNWDDYPETISKNWIPIEKMKEVAKFNPNFRKNIDFIRSKGFAGWKKSRGDGNCYFRAVMVRFLEFLFKVSTPLDYAVRFLDTLKRHTEIFLKSAQYRNKQFIQFIREKEELEKWMNYYLEMKQKYPVNSFLNFISYTQSIDFDRAFIHSARLLTASFLLSNDERISMFFDESLNNQITKILTMGEEAEGLALLALPLSLGIKVVQYNLFDTAVNVMEFPDDSPGEFEVSIIRRGGHYDILYKIQELEDEQYNFATGCYHFPLNS